MAEVQKFAWFDRLIAVLAGLVAVGTSLFPAYDWYIGKTSPHLSYVVNPARTLIADPMRTSRVGVLVNGKPSSRRIFASQILVYNDGAYPIEPKDFTNDKLRVTSIPPTPLIDASIQAATSPNAVGFKLIGNNLTAGEVLFSWDLLERDDAAIIQVVYEQPAREPAFVVAGRLKGQHEPRRVIVSGAERLHEIRAHTFLLAFLGLIELLLVTGFLYGLLKKNILVWVTSGLGVVAVALFGFLKAIISPTLPLGF